jgi:Uma2 family endonuclease
MGSVVTIPEQRTLLQNVSWEAYELRLTNHRNTSSPRFTFDRGVLEIMSPSSEHEEYKNALTLMVQMLADALGMDIRSLGSTTFKRSDLKRGFEADACFYIQSAGRVESNIHIDPAVDPAPDLVIEIEISAPVLNKLPVYADFRVPEIWRYDGKRLVILHLHGTEYTECSESRAFPKASAAELSRLVQRSILLRSREWLRELRNWAQRLSSDSTPS